MVAAFAGLALARRDLVAFEVTVLMITWIVLIPSGALLGVVFRRAGHALDADSEARTNLQTGLV